MEIHCKHDPFAAMHSKSSYCHLLEISCIDLEKKNILIGSPSPDGVCGRQSIFFKEAVKTLRDLGVCFTGRNYRLLCIDSYDLCTRSYFMAYFSHFNHIQGGFRCVRLPGLLIVCTLCRRLGHPTGVTPRT